ncbi:hypothetical protein K3162_09770 [Qipengyuania xiapuensis]|uniref:Uncharacterized protein n=1 Tax=Qipengyuania xiapuensis TaxID=2867236 RepID=A0ABX8ZSG2_9SPHN|nr:hypothetical protein [Qipengyuania xiapuensis]QZD91839.1 hypothetical protein K3162_09770 [Qipengyuania xiapuensis]
MIRLASLTLALALALAAPAIAQDSEGEVTPLFASDETLEVTITGPVGHISRRAQRSTDPYPAQIEVAGEIHTITLAARGKSRRKRENCRFPPLRVAFPQKPDENSLFHRQGSIKLVTHCRDRDASEQTILREYAAYRLYNIVTPESLKVRLARIRYMDEGELVTQRLGFFIEDGDDAARRLGRKEIDTSDISVSWLDQQDAARYALFQYMIGNTDWSMVLSPEGDDCCHNSRLFGEDKAARRSLTPVPYDFDNAGLVDATYAAPNAQLGTHSVKTRVYRGFCTFNGLVAAEAENLRSLRGEFEAELTRIPHADARTKSAMASYLAGFFEDIASSESMERKLFRKCR